MAIKSVVKMGNPKLAEPSLPVSDFSDPQLQDIVRDMLDTMQKEGGVGIAAPQIGYNVRIIMFGFESNPRYPEESSVPFTVLINPDIQVLGTDMDEGWEGCLSVPGLRGLVPRYSNITYTGYDLNNQRIERSAEGFHARVVQHECDHLDGLLYPRRIKDLRNFGYEDELRDLIWPKNR